MTKQERKLAKYKKEIKAQHGELTKQLNKLNKKEEELSNYLFSREVREKFTAEEQCDKTSEYGKKMDQWHKMRRAIEKLEDEIGALRNELLPLDQKYMSQFLWSDVHAYKVVREFTPCTCGVIRLITKVKEGAEPMSNEWDFELPEYTEDEIITVRKHKNGRWYFPHDSCPLVLLDHPYEHYDYNF